MPKGESSREKVRLQILKFLFNDKATSPKIIEACDAAKNTVYKYLNELIEEKKVIWNPHRERGKSTYNLSAEARDEIKLLLEKQEIKNKIDQMAPEEFQKINSIFEGSNK